MRPLLAVANRFGVGSTDKYNRGTWITFEDALHLQELIRNSKNKIVLGDTCYVAGTNQHNHVADDALAVRMNSFIF
jgi:hypothetical protein